MNTHPLIFSFQPKYRIGRHVLFWTFWTLFQGILYTVVPSPVATNYWQKILPSLFDSLVYLPGHLFSAYALMYFVIPRYVVKNKYLSAGWWTCVVILATAAIQSLISLYPLLPLKQAVFGEKVAIPYKFGQAPLGKFHLAMMAGLRGSLTITGMAAAIKLMKHWYVEGQRNLQLQKEAVQSQLQVLKAQVHPHFLFNTLNNIYAHTQATSPTASALVMGLSDMLRYMLYECNQPLVPLAKELKMLEEYIALETVRYGNELELHVDFPEDAAGFYTAPLLLLPFVENAFKHGVSNVLEHPWLSLSVSLQGHTATVKVINGKAANGPSSPHQGIGIENVRRRLALLYPGKHELAITAEEDVFIVNLKLQLDKKAVAIPTIAQPAGMAAFACCFL